MNLPSEMDVLTLVCSQLDHSRIPYMLTGSLALNFYSTPRMTRDIDLVIELTSPDVNVMLDLFKTNFYIDESMIKDAIQRQSMFNIVHFQSVYKIDFIIRKESEYRKTEFQRRRSVIFNNTPIWIVAPEDLIISKLSWARDSFSDMQIKDIKLLLKSTSYLDIEYIQKWVQKLNLIDIYDKVKTI